MKRKQKELESTIKIAWIIFTAVLIFTLVLEFFIHPHVTFSIQEIPFFNAFYGFLSCIAIILVSKFFGIFVKRDEEYYEGDEK